MFEWIRKLPHPGYGKCGGMNRDCSLSKPRDWMDKAFAEHDEDLRKAKTKIQKDAAHRKLGNALRKGDPRELSLYGRLYLFSAKIVFRGGV